jgi:SOS-response transcriptional repressor LexA
LRYPNKALLDRLAEYIRDFQIREGRSPNQREIVHDLKTDKAAAWRYVHHLEKAGAVSLDDTGKIKMDAALDGFTARAPLVGEVRCGEPIVAEATLQEVLTLPEAFTQGCGNCFALIAKGDSMNQAGIREGDFLVLRDVMEAYDGDIVLAVHPGFSCEDEEITLKRYRRIDGKYWLCPESDNARYKKIPADEFVIRGVLIGYYHLIGKPKKHYL